MGIARRASDLPVPAASRSEGATVADVSACLEVVKVLLAAGESCWQPGADVAARDDRGKMPLHEVAQKPAIVEGVRGAPTRKAWA